MSPLQLVHAPLHKNIRNEQILLPRPAHQEQHTSSALLTEYLKQDSDTVEINTHAFIDASKQSSLEFMSLEAPLPGLSSPFLTIRGEAITFYQQEGQWKAHVKERAGALQRARILPVYHHPSLHLTDLNKLNKGLTPYRLHIIEQGGNPYLYLGKMGLLGGTLHNVHGGDAEEKEEPGVASATGCVYSTVIENLGLAIPVAQREERQRLQAYYQNQFAYIPKLLPDEAPQPVITAQYELMLLEPKLPPKNPQAKEIQESIIAAQDQWQVFQSPIYLAELFKPRNTQAGEPAVQGVRKVLLVGDSGIGKTTVSRQIAYLWAIGHEDAGFQAVYILPVRALKKTKYDGSTLRSEINLATAIANLCFEKIEDEEVYKRLRSQIQLNLSDPNTLVILDGLDERLVASEALLEEAHKGLHKLLLVSRPSGVEGLRKRVDREVVHAGFSQSQVETYVYNYFSVNSDNKDKANGLLAFFKQYPEVAKLAHVPLTLCMLCSLWAQAAEQVQAARGSLTNLHRQLADYLWKRYAATYNADLPEDRWLQNKDRDELFSTLGQIALHSLISGEATISLQTFEHVLAKLAKENPLRAMLQESGLLARVGMDYQFPHFSLQEYFAGRALAEYVLSGQGAGKIIVKDFLSAYQYQSLYQGVFAYLAGELSQAQGEIGLATLLRMLKEGPKEVVGLQHLFLELVCLNAYLLLDIGFPKGIEKEFACMNKLERWFMQGLTQVHSYDSQLLNLLVGKLQSLPAVAQVASKIWDMLQVATQDANGYVRYTAIQHLGNLIKATQAQATTVLPTLEAALGDNKNYVRVAAIWSLFALLQAAPVHTATVVPVILAATKNQDQHVLQAVSKALDKLLCTDPSYVPIILSTLLAAAKDQDQSVLQAVSKTLDKLVCTDPNYVPTILSTLLAAAKNQNDHVRKAAIYCLGSLIQASQAHALAALPTLQTTMGDQDKYVREATIKALIMLVRVAPAQAEVVLASLITALQDQDGDIRHLAIVALAKLVQAAPDQAATVFPMLVTATKDQDKSMRVNAIWALGSLVPEVPGLAAEVLPILLAATGDKAIEVRSTVGDMLKELVQVNANQARQLLPGLLTATEHKYYWVCKASIQALGKLVQTAPEKAAEVLPNLKAAAKANYKVRKATIQVLSDLIQANAVHVLEALPTLQAATVDKEYEVRKVAIEALRKLLQAVPDYVTTILSFLLTALNHQDDWSTSFGSRQFLTPLLLEQLMQSYFATHPKAVFYIDELPIPKSSDEKQDYDVYQAITKPLVGLMHVEQSLPTLLTANMAEKDYVYTAISQAFEVFSLANLIQGYTTKPNKNLLLYILQRGWQIPLVFQDSKKGFQQLVAYTATHGPEVLGEYPIQAVQKLLQRLELLQYTREKSIKQTELQIEAPTEEKDEEENIASCLLS